MTTTTAVVVESEEPVEEGDLGQQIVEVMLEIHAAYADSQHRSGSRHQRVYGQIFADLPDRLRDLIGAPLGAFHTPVT